MQNSSIKKGLVVIILIVNLFTLSIGFTSFVLWFTKNQYENNLEFAKTISEVIGQNIAKIVLLDDVAAAADVTTSLRSFPKLNSLILYNLDKKPIYQYNKEDRTIKAENLKEGLKHPIRIDGHHLFIITDASYQGMKLGFIKMDISIATISDILLEYKTQILLIALVLIAISSFLANYYAKKFTRPIIKLVNFLKKLEVNELLDERIFTNEKNEYGLLYDEVNFMLDKIQKSHKELKIAAAAFETQSGMTITDKNNTILDVNSAFEKITGYTKEEVVGKTPSILKSGLHDEEFYKIMRESLQKHNYWSGRIYNKHKNGSIYIEYLTIQVVRDDNNEILYYVASFTDITLQEQMQAKLEYLEKYDRLTGLANKTEILKRLQDHLDKGCSNAYGALFCLDIKDFKLINEAYGYEMGDQLLKALAKRLKQLKKAVLVGRISSDEFVIWIDEIDQDKTTAFFEATLFAEKTTKRLTQPYTIQNNTINIIISMGVMLYNYKYKDASVLLQYAETALHNAKKEEQKILFFDKAYQNIAQTQIDIYSKLIDAIKNEEFELFYQLQFNQHKQPYGVEALIRLHYANETICPDVFIPIAEKSGLIVEIGDWIIQESCKQLALWQQDPKTASLSIAVNVSAKQFAHKDFVQKIKKNLDTYAIQPQHLKIELTESIILNDFTSVVEKMRQLKEIGVKISLDDFGTGYSSLQYLRDLPLDQVKIDQAFVKNLLHSEVDKTIIKAVVLMGEAMQLEVIAEGVETKEHFELLVKLGCTHFQGYYFTPPKKANELEEVIRQFSVS